MASLSLDIAQIRGWIMDASQIALRYFGHVNAEWKGVDDPVTVADREVEQFLTARIRETYPTHGLIGEEFGSDTLDREYLWTVDPIDGTRVYLHGLPTWSLTIALLHEFKPIFGLVYLPMLNDWTYTEGDDIIHNGESIRDRLLTSWETDTHLFVRSDAHALHDIHFKRIMGLGSSATHFAFTARGAGLATVVLDSYLWDMAAGAAFLAKQGGVLQQPDGSPVDFSTRDLTQRIDGLVIGAHPNVAPRVAAQFEPRTEPVVHPAW